MCRDRSTKAPKIWHAKSHDRGRGASRELREKVEMLLRTLNHSELPGDGGIEAARCR